MIKNSDHNSTEPTSLVNIDSPDDFSFEGKTSVISVLKAKKVKRLTNDEEEFSRVDNPDDIEANFSKMKD